MLMNKNRELEEELNRVRNEPHVDDGHDETQNSADMEWEVHFDNDSGDMYYYNNVSGVTSWERPPGVDYLQEEENRMMSYA